MLSRAETKNADHGGMLYEMTTRRALSNVVC